VGWALLAWLADKPQGLTYVTVAPADGGSSTTPGLLVLLHGSGGDEYDLIDVGREVAPRGYLIASLRAPLEWSWGGYRWFRGSSTDPDPKALGIDGVRATQNSPSQNCQDPQYRIPDSKYTAVFRR
jgi:predicted esterase